MTPPERIVSLVPSATEIVCLLGAHDRLVGRSHECDFPGAALRAAPLTSQTTPAGTAGEIDAAVRASLASGRSLYRLDAPALARLAPDLIITQDLCGVCSIDQAAVRVAAAGLNPAPEILSLNPTTLDDVLDDVLRVGAAIGCEAGARDAVVGLRERLDRAAEFVNAYCEGPVVAFLEWTDPLFIAGHWVPQLVERAGARHPLNPSSPPAPSRTVSAEELVRSMPEAIVIGPCGMGLGSARACAAALAGSSWWGEIPAVRRGRVAVVDGNATFSRPGPRLVDCFEWLVGWLHDRPEVIPPAFAWVDAGT